MAKKSFSIIDGASCRVALYIRVSGEEQKIKGLSLEAQQERLEAFAREKGWSIVGIYIDAAKTARKNIHKRTEFLRMLEAVKRDEVDLLLFCRLDRWFRSVADYYKVIEILEKHNCGWKTIDEDYDTSTANGRLYINVKLSIAQNEADICGERIAVVFDSKIAHGSAISGSYPYGYRLNSEKKLEIDPDAAAVVRDAFNRYENTVTMRGTTRYIRETYGVNWCCTTFRRILSQPLYTGSYNRHGRQNDNFCPAIISKDQFERVQTLLSKNVKYYPTGKIYLFSSLLVCDECGHRLSGFKSKAYHYYRCQLHHQYDTCSNNSAPREDIIEAWLFDHLQEEIERCKLEWKLKNAEHQRRLGTNEKAALKNKLTKLKELYVNDLIDLEDYKKDYEIYTAALNQLTDPVQETAPDFSAAERLLQSDFKALYDKLSQEDKRTLWRSVIKEIRINKAKKIVGIFFA